MADIADFVDIVVKVLKNPKMKFIVIPISWILRPLIMLFYRVPFIQVMNVSFEIEKLEGQKKYDEARLLRHTWLAKYQHSQSEILLCSEGKDLLYNKKEYSKALQTFEKVITIDPCYNPIEVYYGASCAALFTKDHQKAKKYYVTFKEWWDKFKNDPKLKDYMNRYSGCKNWLENNIDKRIES